jgi:flagellar protein FliL
MADAKKDDAPAPAKKGGKKKLILMVVGGLVLAGGGVAGGMFAAGMGGGGAHANEPHRDPDAPELEVREGQKASSADEFKPVGSFKPDPKVYKASYYTMDQPFTSNLSNTDGVIQIGIGMSTYYDHKVTDAMKDNDMPLRSAALGVIAQSDALALSTPQGKAGLQGQLKDAFNKVLVDKTGYGGVDSVYFTSFIIQ